MISIDQSKVKELFHYEDGKLFWKVKASRKTNIGEEAGTLRDIDGYRQIMINKKTYRTHRLIFLYHHGYMPSLIDHINNNCYDNRIENLREASISQNGANSKIRTDNTSGVKGVTWDKAKSKWSVRIHVNSMVKFLGRFSDFELAEFISKESREFYHGKFARHGAMQ